MERQWTANNRADLRAFLGSETGTMLMNQLHEKMPKVLGTTLEQVALEGADIRGFLKCISEIKTLAQTVKGSTKNPETIDNSKD